MAEESQSRNAGRLVLKVKVVPREGPLLHLVSVCAQSPTAFVEAHPVPGCEARWLSAQSSTDQAMSAKNLQSFHLAFAKL